jgi:6-phosphofructokinase
VKLIGFINGLKGLMNEDVVEINEESFKPFRNLGGYDYLGRSHDFLRTLNEQKQAASVCKKLGLNGLVLIGATHTMSDGCALSEYFLANEIDTSVVVVPATVNGNIRNSYISTSIGFDTASKVYS